MRQIQVQNTVQCARKRGAQWGQSFLSRLYIVVPLSFQETFENEFFLLEFQKFQKFVKYQYEIKPVFSSEMVIFTFSKWNFYQNDINRFIQAPNFHLGSLP